MKKTRKILSVILALIMVFSVIPMSSIVASATITGDSFGSLTWWFNDQTGVLNISGNGYMSSYSVTTNAQKSPWYSYKDDITTVVIEDGVLSIGNAAFYNCTNLESITIPDTVVSIGNYAFKNCKKLNNISIPESVTSIGDYAFSDCLSLTSIVIPYGVEEIGVQTFYFCQSLKEVSIPSTVTLINNRAFHNCDSLEAIYIPNGVTQIATYAFWSCQALTSVTLPESLTYLGGAVFMDCTSLKSLTIPENVNDIGADLFENCPDFTDVYYGGTLKKWIASSRDGVMEGVTIHCGGENHTHKYGEWTEYSKAYCEDTGVETRKCETCSREQARAIPATGHNYTSVVTAPTCSNQGYTTYKCSNCNDSYVTEYVSSLGHNYDSGVVTASTCTEKGYTTYTCLECGQKSITDYTPAKGHSYKSVVRKPTCTEKGYTTHTCTSCGNQTVDNYVDALGHDVVEWETTKEPTCTTMGSEKGLCRICNQYVTQTISSLGHDYSELKVDYDATCTSNGRKCKECLTCGYKTAIEVIPATGHAYGEWMKLDDAKCGEYSKYERICGNCGVSEFMNAPGEHTYTIESNVVDATCTEPGSKTVECEDCGHVANMVIPAKGHTCTPEITTPATHTKEGLMTYTCHCGYSYTETIKKTEEHKHNAVVTAPTCTEQGYTTYICECGDSYVDDYVDATGHTRSEVPVEENYVAPTCTNSGRKNLVYYCKYCNYKYSTTTVTIPALGHTPEEAVEENYIAPTCTDRGSMDMVTYCSVCDEEISRYTVAVVATGHTTVDYERNVAPTCTEKGVKEIISYCVVCNKGVEVKTTVVPALGHTPKDAVTENYVAPTSAKDGSKDIVVYCSVCDGEISRQTVVVKYDEVQHFTGIDGDYFYKDGVKQKAYQLVEFEGDFYFINDSHKLAKNKTLYLSERFVTGFNYADGTPLQVGYYEFDENGKMIIHNGVVGDYFYKNNVRQNAYQLVEFEGNYYFINDSHKLAKNKRIYLSQRFVEGTDLAVGYYEFDADGKMILLNGPVGDYFYKDNVRLKAYQIVEFEGDYYFVYDSHKLAKNTRLYLSERFVDGTDLKVGWYTFDADGKMVIE